MSKKKIRQGQSRWIVWVYQEINRAETGALEDFTRRQAGDLTEASAGGEKTYHLERVEVVNVIDGGRSIIIKMGNQGNKSTWPAEEFLKCPDTYRKARRSMLEHQARA